MNLLNILISAFIMLCEIIRLMIVLRVVLSWIVRDYSNPLMRITVMFTEPVIQPFRRIIAKSPFGNMRGLDISPAFAYLTIEFVVMFLQGSII